ncbi:MAG: UDP-N-acetylglucosamine 2-epimerase (non-hydrolyzing) [Elusimicrobia bacterium]|nr:UDP-N-acetylglucosamine 2-epimerase (non-hydrolyzing) [Elusimicrobiota bacterium]
MKVLTILGTRPEIIRLSLVIPLLDGLCAQTVVHTGQNFDPNLNDVFFEQLGLRAPDRYLGAKGSLAEQIGVILAGTEKAIAEVRPDRLLVLGDTNSALSALIAKRLGVPVYHMEAGNRCYDDRVPEEVNRRVIDHSSDVLMPYTERSRQNLLAEGIPGERVYVTGNPIREVLDKNAAKIDKCGALKELGLRRGGYFLATLHRAENVDDPRRFADLVAGLNAVAKAHGKPVVWSVHPRTRARLAAAKGVKPSKDVRVLDPLGLFEFVQLEKNALCVLTDSGTVQEECCLFRVPNVTVRDVTERPETLEAGSNILSGADPETVLACVKTALSCPARWTPPTEYEALGVSATVAKIILGYRLPRLGGAF